MSARDDRRGRGAGPARGRGGNAGRESAARPGGRGRETLRRAGAGRARAPWLIGAAVLVLAVGAWLAFQRWERHPAGDSAGPDPAALLSPPAAYQHALTLGRAERHLESLPYFRRALRAVREDFWEIHFDYSAALYNLTRAYQMKRGIQVPLLRSAYERVAVMKESLAELDRAERLARSPRDQAGIQARRAQMMEVWGFPWETLVAYGQVINLDPSRTSLVVRATVYSKLMKTPNEVGKE